VERLSQQRGAAVAATPFDELNDLLTRFVDRLSSILGAKLVGVYLTGSFALDAGDAASDCDFLAVTDGNLSPDDERRLRQCTRSSRAGPATGRPTSKARTRRGRTSRR
jgi:hypothetical protein